MDDPPEPSVMLAAFVEAVRPGGVAEVERVMVPVKPLRLVRVRVDVEDDPAWMVMLSGLPARLKSIILRLIETEWTSDPLVPVTVTV